MLNKQDLAKVDNKRTIILPEAIMKKIELHESTYLKVLVCNDNILLKKIQCVFCGNGNIQEINQFKGKEICNNCTK